MVKTEERFDVSSGVRLVCSAWSDSLFLPNFPNLRELSETLLKARREALHAVMDKHLTQCPMEEMGHLRAGESSCTKDNSCPFSGAQGVRIHKS